MNGNRRMLAAASVVTVWTKPESPRALDEPALRKPADIAGWLASMTIRDKLELSESNRIQTQILYGTEVLVTGEASDWALIRIPEQSTSKDTAGYPGWVPKRQLREVPDRNVSDGWAEVITRKARLALADTDLELSFLTRLPVRSESPNSITVDTPDGIGTMRREDVRIHSGGEAGLSVAESTDATEEDRQEADVMHKGLRILDQGMRFLGLPYLWGGMSSFGYDCSGFAYSMHRSLGIAIPRDASDQARHGEEISREHLQPGDLLFFARDRGRGGIHHVAIYAGGNRLLHSPNSKGCIELILLDESELAVEHCVSIRYWK